MKSFEEYQIIKNLNKYYGQTAKDWEVVRKV